MFKQSVSGLCFQKMKSRIMLRRRYERMSKNKVVIKGRDEWSGFVAFLGNMIAKYAEVINFDSLPNPEIYLLHRTIRDSYKTYVRERNKRRLFHIEYVMLT